MTTLSRPKLIGGITVRKATGCGNMYIQMNWYHGKLFELFATLGHSGGCSMSYTEALTRSITTGLRQLTSVPLEEYVDQLEGIRCPSPHPFPKEDSTLSCPDAIAQAIKEYGNLTMKEIVELILNADTDTTPLTDEDTYAAQELSRLKHERDLIDHE